MIEPAPDHRRPVRIYVSSTFYAREDRSDDLAALRLDLQRRGRRFAGVEVELAEQDEAIRRARERDDVPAVLEGCARRMSGCDAFFGMLFERHGDGVRLDREDSRPVASMSIFEAELLHASMAGKSICVAQARELPPGPELAAFLRIVGRALGPAIRVVDRRSLPELFEDFCRTVARPAARPGAWVFDDVGMARVRRSIGTERQDPLLRFGDGMLASDGAGGADPGVVRSALDRVAGGTASDGRALGQLERLSYLWMALRELSRATVEERLSAMAAETDRALGLWNSSAAWYGIHGAHPLGGLAALNDLEAVRAVTGTGPPLLGPRASAYYSVGARLRARPAARRYFHQSLRMSREAVALGPADPSGAMQMAASAEARLALLGSPWRYLTALREFRRSYRWRVSHGASDAAIGEALNAYAHALGRISWMRGEALRMAADASDLLRPVAGGGDGGHYLRGERKRADLLRAAGRLDEARSVALAARDLAVVLQVEDQVRQIDQTLAAWAAHGQ